MDELTNNPTKTLDLANTAMQSTTKIVNDSVTKLANRPTTKPLDEQL
jgi:hypothetical protein